MKKLFLISLIAITGFVNAQSIILTSPLTVTNGLITPPNTDVTNDTIMYCVTDLNSMFDGGQVIVINNTASAMGVDVERFADEFACFTSNQFCWTICYSPWTSVSPDSIVIPAYDSTGVFHGWVDPDGHEGCCYIKYRFFDSADTTVYSDVTIKYCFANVCTPDVGIDEVSSTQMSLYPNPASDIFTMEFAAAEKGGIISLMDLTGKVAKQINVPSGITKINIPIDGLQNGVYLCSLLIDGKATSTKKIIVKK